MDDLQEAFWQESSELLEQFESGLLHLEKNPQGYDAEIINTLFRCAHTIKGGAGVVQFDALVGFTHVVESLMDLLRKGEMQLSADLVALLLECKDYMGTLLSIFADNLGNLDERTSLRGCQLQECLMAKLQDSGTGKVLSGVPSPQGQPAASSHSTDYPSSNQCWHISIRFSEPVLKQGMDPLSFLRYLASLGEIKHVETLCDGMPAATEMDPESCYLGFEIDFSSHDAAVDKKAIERVFDFVRDDCLLRILPPSARLSEYLQLIEDLPEDNMRLGEILVKSGALTESELVTGLQLQMLSGESINESTVLSSAHKPIGAVLVEQQMVQPELIEAAVRKQSKIHESRSKDAALIRVQAEKLDKLIDLVGELVIAGAASSMLAQASGQGQLVESCSVISRLVESIRNSALQLRMVQIGETFNRFHRVVRDVSKELGKDIELVINGSQTELDKSVVEMISDPLMHLVRNAMDHGIETAENRLAQGKPARGQLCLNASHASGSVLIQVTDDGAGLNRERIFEKAVERGLVSASQNLADADIYRLIFEPGFSTAETVTNLSGRGVGMDVVKRNIEALRGTVDVDSVPGKGTCFSIRLPLTLAIIDGFLVGIGKHSYVIPLDCVVECLELDIKQFQTK